jgi:hypothetical protein
MSGRGESVNASSTYSGARSGHQPAHALGDSPGFTGHGTPLFDPELVEAIAQRTAAIVLEALAAGTHPPLVASSWTPRRSLASSAFRATPSMNTPTSSAPSA